MMRFLRKTMLHPQSKNDSKIFKQLLCQMRFLRDFLIPKASSKKGEWRSSVKHLLQRKLKNARTCRSNYMKTWLSKNQKEKDISRCSKLRECNCHKQSIKKKRKMRVELLTTNNNNHSIITQLLNSRNRYCLQLQLRVLSYSLLPRILKEPNHLQERKELLQKL